MQLCLLHRESAEGDGLRLTSLREKGKVVFCDWGEGQFPYGRLAERVQWRRLNAFNAPHAPQSARTPRDKANAKSPSWSTEDSERCDLQICAGC